MSPSDDDVDYSIAIITTYISGCINSSVYSLKCYQCHSSSSEPCPEEHLKDCPATQAFDRCILIMKKTSTEELLVKRECALAPCNIRDKAVDSIIKLREQCKMNTDEFDCTYCCKHDGCNKDGGSHPSVNAMLLFASLLLITRIAIRL